MARGTYPGLGQWIFDAKHLDPDHAVGLAAASFVTGADKTDRPTVAGQRLTVLLPGEHHRAVAEVRIELAPGDDDLWPSEAVMTR